jgi:hypothetical protein
MAGALVVAGQHAVPGNVEGLKFQRRRLAAAVIKEATASAFAFREDPGGMSRTALRGIPECCR